MFQDVISRIHRGSSTTSQSDGLPARRHVLLAVRDPVDHTPRVVTQIHRPVTTKRNPHRTPHPTSSFLLARCQPPGNEILRATLRLPFVVESHAYNFVSGRNAPIPRSMKCDEDCSSFSRAPLSNDSAEENPCNAVFISVPAKITVRRGALQGNDKVQYV